MSGTKPATAVLCGSGHCAQSDGSCNQIDSEDAVELAAMGDIDESGHAALTGEVESRVDWQRG